MTTEALHHALRDADLPDFVVDRKFEVGLDSTGEDAVWVWIIVSDEMRLTQEQVSDLRDRIRSCLTRADEGVWPYVRFRTLSEQTALDREAAGK